MHGCECVPEFVKVELLATRSNRADVTRIILTISAVQAGSVSNRFAVFEEFVGRLSTWVSIGSFPMRLGRKDEARLRPLLSLSQQIQEEIGEGDFTDAFALGVKLPILIFCSVLSCDLNGALHEVNIRPYCVTHLSVSET